MIKLEALQKMRGFIKRGWTQFTYARNKDGDAVNYSGRSACCWCLTGAARKARCEAAFCALWDQMYPRGRSAWGWNDRPGRTRGQVLRRLDSMIAFVKKQTKA